MDILTTVPVQVNGPESIPSLLDAVRTRITYRAYENFVERGFVHGQDLDDWLSAERDLIIKSIPSVQMGHEDIFVEMALPEIDLLNLAVYVSPSQLVVASDP